MKKYFKFEKQIKIICLIYVVHLMLCYKVFQLNLNFQLPKVLKKLKLIMSQNSPKPKIMVENVSCILPEQSDLGGLFVGNVYGAQNPAILKQYGIRAVLTSSIETNISYGFQDIPFHMRIQAHDKEDYNLKDHINKCIDFIQKSRQLTNVYVHCFAGVSRSVAIVCAYIMWKLKWNYETTIAFVKAKRIVAKPNEGFVKQLLEIENILMQLSCSQTPDEQSETSLKPKTQSNSTLESQYNYPPSKSIDKTLAEQTIKQTLFHTGNSIQMKNYTYADSSYVEPYSVLQNSSINQNLDHSYQQSSQVYKNSSQSSYVNSTQPAQNLYDVNHLTKINQQTQKKQVNGRFNYLQNFFPQNQSTTKQIEAIKTQGNFSQLTVEDRLSQHKPGTPRQSLKKLQNTLSSSFKNAHTYHIQKPSTPSNHHLILGGKKHSFNPNNTPVPKVPERTEQSKLYQNSTRMTIGQTQQARNFYRASRDKYSMHRTTIGHDFNIVSPQIKEMWNSSQKTDQPLNYHNLRQNLPVSNNTYSQQFDFRSSAPIEGFYTNKTSAQKREAKKQISRCLVRPKDLPGYKNY